MKKPVASINYSVMLDSKTRAIYLDLLGKRSVKLDSYEAAQLIHFLTLCLAQLGDSKRSQKESLALEVKRTKQALRVLKAFKVSPVPTEPPSYEKYARLRKELRRNWATPATKEALNRKKK